MELKEARNEVGILDIEIDLSKRTPEQVLGRLLHRHDVAAGRIGRVDCCSEAHLDVAFVSSMWQYINMNGEDYNVELQHFSSLQQSPVSAIINCLYWIDSQAWDRRYGIFICVSQQSTVVCLLGRMAPLHFDLKSKATFLTNNLNSNCESAKRKYLEILLKPSACIDGVLLADAEDVRDEGCWSNNNTGGSNRFFFEIASLVARAGESLDGRNILIQSRASAFTETYLVIHAFARNGTEDDNAGGCKFSLSRMQDILLQQQSSPLLPVHTDEERTAAVGVHCVIPPQGEQKLQRTVRVVITGVSAALPGREGHVFTPGVNNIQRIIDGECFITPIPDAVKDAMLEKNVCIQGKNKEGVVVQRPVTTYADTINVCAALGKVDLSAYGIADSIVSTMDSAVQVAIVAGLEALRGAGLVTGKGGKGTSGWELPVHMQNTTGVVYATSFPALDTAIAEVTKFFAAKSVSTAAASVLIGELRRRLQVSATSYGGGDGEVQPLSAESEGAFTQLEALLQEMQVTTNPNIAVENENAVVLPAAAAAAAEPYQFDRKFLFRVLVLGNAQLAQIIKAKGPNMQTNAACAGATQAIALAYDMIQVGRAERVVVIAGDSASSDTLMPWLGNGFRALGAATLSATPSEAARPFQAARSGMILGSGGIGMVLESEAAALQRFALTTAPTQPQLPDEGSTASFFSSAVGTAAATATSSPATPATPRTPFRCRLLGTQLSNSAFHGAAMDREHIAAELERFVSSMEAQCGVSRGELAQQGVYFSHETGTHASPSSSCAANEIYALRKVFGEHLKDLLILNTKGFTGHPMGVSFEDVVAVDVLATGRVPPVANFTAAARSCVDPYLGEDLKISRGGVYPCKYALRFAAGFGSQIALALYGSA